MTAAPRARKAEPENSKGEEVESPQQQIKENTGLQVERVLIEFACVALLLSLTVGCLFVFNVSPLFKTSRQSPGSVLVILVLSMYAAFRAYFGGAFALLRWVQAIPLVAASSYRAFVSQAVVAAATLSGLALLYVAFPEARVSLAAGLWSSLGDLPEVLERSFQGEKQRLYERGWKVLGLLVGWTLFFFAFELLARLGLWLTLGLIRAVARGLRAGGLPKKVAAAAPATGAEEVEDAQAAVGEEEEEEELNK